MASTFSLKSAKTYQTRYLIVELSQQQDIARNVNVITWKLSSVGGTSNYYDTGPTTLKIAGQTIKTWARSKYNAETNPKPAFPTSKGSESGTLEVSANADGTCSVEVSLTTAIYTGTQSTSTDTWYLDTIPRAAQLLSADNFNADGNPTITYSNPAGSAATVQVAIYNTDGNTSYAGYRTISSTGTSYTFSLTADERQKLKNAVPSGSNTMYVNFYIKTIINGSTVSGSIRYLTRIVTVNRAATISSAPDFNDEGNPTITYNNPNGNNVDTLKACICNTAGSVIYADYRDISKTGTSYTFNLTDTERQALINAIPSGSSSVKIKYVIRTTIGSSYTGYSESQKTLSITNAQPNLTWVLQDAGTASQALTHNQDVIIKGFNYVTASMTPTFKKGATALSQTITNGGNTVNGLTANFNNTESGLFTFSIKDSFGQVVTKNGELTVIPYIKPTCSLDDITLATTGTLSFKIKGNYFNDKFGTDGENNVLTVKWKIKEGNGDYGDWITATAHIVGNLYEATISYPGLDYRKTYTIQAMVSDLVVTSGVTTPERVISSIPTYNWGEENFDVNVPFNAEEGAYISNGATISGGTTFNGGTYFNGDVAMNKNLNIDGQINAASLSASLAIALLKKAYPVGSIYMNYTDSTNPNSIFGFGTWEKITGRFLWATTSTPGLTGGSQTKTISIDNMPAHNHAASSTSTYSGANFYIRHGHNSGTDSVKAGSYTSVSEGVGDTWSTGFTTSNYSHKLDQVVIGGSVTTSTSTSNRGGGQALNIMPPYLEVYIWKRTA